MSFYKVINKFDGFINKTGDYLLKPADFCHNRITHIKNVSRNMDKKSYRVAAEIFGSALAFTLATPLALPLALAGISCKFSSYCINKIFNKKNKSYLETLKPNLAPSTKELTSITKARTEALHDIFNTCSEENVECWAEGGSALGILRSNKLIPHDHCAYVSIMESEYDKMEAAMNKLVESHPEKYALEDWSAKTDEASNRNYLRLKIKNSANSQYVNIYSYKEVKEGVISWIDPHPDSNPCNIWANTDVKKDLIFPLSQADLSGKKVPVPGKLRDYSLLRYGDLRPEKVWSTRHNNYIDRTGSSYVKEQQNLTNQVLPNVTSDEEAQFTGDYTNMELTPTEPSREKSHPQWKQLVFNIQSLFKAANIDWWMDAGTLIGVYRYKGGAITPWDHDVDISVLQKDFDRIYNLFNSNDRELMEKFGIKREDYALLDKSKFSLQDWSQKAHVDQNEYSRKNYLRLKLEELDDYLDIYTYRLEPDSVEKGEPTVAWNEPYPRDMAYMKWHNSIPAKMMFPLKQAPFYGVNVPVPNNTEEYLGIRYGDIRPCKVWNPETKTYDNIANHEYHSDLGLQANKS